MLTHNHPGDATQAVEHFLSLGLEFAERPSCAVARPDSQWQSHLDSWQRPIGQKNIWVRATDVFAIQYSADYWGSQAFRESAPFQLLQSSGTLTFDTAREVAFLFRRTNAEGTFTHQQVKDGPIPSGLLTEIGSNSQAEVELTTMGVLAFGTLNHGGGFVEIKQSGNSIVHVSDVPGLVDALKKVLLFKDRHS